MCGPVTLWRKMQVKLAAVKCCLSVMRSLAASNDPRITQVTKNANRHAKHDIFVKLREVNAGYVFTNSTVVNGVLFVSACTLRLRTTSNQA
jgi:hypothetical protein